MIANVVLDPGPDFHRGVTVAAVWGVCLTLAAVAVGWSLLLDSPNARWRTRLRLAAAALVLAACGFSVRNHIGAMDDENQVARRELEAVSETTTTKPPGP
jgi:hypothetical protein